MNNTTNTKETGVQRLKMDQLEMRDYFAAKALEGMLACYRDPVMNAPDLRAKVCADAVAKQAYKFSDAMLKARAE